MHGGLIELATDVIGMLRSRMTHDTLSFKPNEHLVMKAGISQCDLLVL